MYKIAVVDDAVNALGFKALGLDVFSAQDAQEASALIERLAGEEYAIIYLAEHLAVQMPQTIARYVDVLRPAIILIPGRAGSTGLGMETLKNAVERAVGANIMET
jgi:V/A-type H+/Na+-transporting ATPase subunit F